MVASRVSMWERDELQHVMTPVIKCVNNIRARGLNRREFREYCQLLDMEYGDLMMYVGCLKCSFLSDFGN